jgi:hypothetical protein
VQQQTSTPTMNGYKGSDWKEEEEEKNIYRKNVFSICLIFISSTTFLSVPLNK